jgi:hypothetical protein
MLAGGAGLFGKGYACAKREITSVVEDVQLYDDYSFLTEVKATN